MIHEDPCCQQRAQNHPVEPQWDVWGARSGIDCSKTEPMKTTCQLRFVKDLPVSVMCDGLCGGHGDQKSARLTFREVSFLRRTLTEQGRCPKRPMLSLFCGGSRLSLSCDGLCSGRGDHTVCLPHFLGSFFAPSNSTEQGLLPKKLKLQQCLH